MEKTYRDHYLELVRLYNLSTPDENDCDSIVELYTFYVNTGQPHLSARIWSGSDKFHFCLLIAEMWHKLNLWFKDNQHRFQ